MCCDVLKAPAFEAVVDLWEKPNYQSGLPIAPSQRRAAGDGDFDTAHAALIAGIVVTTGLLWWASRDDAGEGPGAPPSLTELVVRKRNAVRLWRAVSAWLSARPARIEDWRTRDS
jgi:hypothetical protein